MRKAGIDVQWVRFEMKFKKPAKTSRGTLLTKPSWLIRLRDVTGACGWGECSIIPGLSMDEPAEIEAHLLDIQQRREVVFEEVPLALPALRFAIEMALADLKTRQSFAPFDGSFAQGQSRIEINGLMWMDDPKGLLDQAATLLKSGFKTLKAKVGSMPFEQELEWMRALRAIAPEVTFRVDANGAFSQPESGWTPLKKLESLAEIGLHSIEQPLHPSDKRGLAELCKVSPVPIALDESLIGVPVEAQGALLDAIDPDFLVLKPSLLGGFVASQHWIQQAEQRDMGWWVTSALETNMGLNAIAQWTANGIQSRAPLLPQGLGTGGLFTNNIPAPLEVSEGYLSTRGVQNWEAPEVRSVS